MYHEIEGQLSIPTIIFDEDELIVGDKHYPYSDIESLEITSAQLFSAYGILTIRYKGKDRTTPFVRSKRHKLELAMKDFEKMRKGGETSLPESPVRTQPAAPAAMDPYEELKKLKELLDMDIITKEEFDAKKKQLLGL